MADLLPDPKIKCHRTGFRKSCRDIVARGQCQLWIGLQGTDPNTGAPIDKFACADSWLPMLMVENSQQQRQTAAAVESFRNEVVSQNSELLSLPQRLRLAIQQVQGG